MKSGSRVTVDWPSHKNHVPITRVLSVSPLLWPWGEVGDGQGVSRTTNQDLTNDTRWFANS